MGTPLYLFEKSKLSACVGFCFMVYCADRAVENPSSADLYTKIKRGVE